MNRSSSQTRQTAFGASPEIWRGLFLILILAIACFYLWSNIGAPLQRDGAHFVFMANNISHGQAPFWASFETKNPLVEIYWSPFIHFLAKPLGIVGAARVAEAVWITLTAIVIFSLLAGARHNPGGSSPSRGAAASLLYLVLALDGRVTDDGFNIALYQSLPELALIALLLKKPQWARHTQGLIVGGLIFLGWFVKQTSLLTDVMILSAYLAVMRRQVHLEWLLAVGAGALVCAGGFLLHLAVTDTLDNYLLGSVTYRSGLTSQLLSEFFTNAYNAYAVRLWQLDLPRLLASHRVWTGIAMLVMMPMAIYRICQTHDQGADPTRLLLVLALSWMIGAWAQAVAALIFFPHYFLASLAPTIVVFGVLLNRSVRLIALPLAGVVALLVAGLVGSYVAMQPINALRSATAPINLSTAEVLRFIGAGDRIFNWSGLPHVLLTHNAPSAFPLNMNWPYIMTALSDEEKTNLLRKTLSNPPDVVVAMNENYPSNQGLSNYTMTVGRLKEVTGRDYVLMHETARREGRYGDSVRVFRLMVDVPLLTPAEN